MDRATGTILTTPPAGSVLGPAAQAPTPVTPPDPQCVEPDHRCRPDRGGEPQRSKRRVAPAGSFGRRPGRTARCPPAQCRAARTRGRAASRFPMAGRTHRCLPACPTGARIPCRSVPATAGVSAPVDGAIMGTADVVYPLHGLDPHHPTTLTAAEGSIRGMGQTDTAWLCSVSPFRPRTQRAAARFPWPATKRGYVFTSVEWTSGPAKSRRWRWRQRRSCPCPR